MLLTVKSTAGDIRLFFGCSPIAADVAEWLRGRGYDVTETAADTAPGDRSRSELSRGAALVQMYANRDGSKL